MERKGEDEGMKGDEKKDEARRRKIPIYKASEINDANPSSSKKSSINLDSSRVWGQIEEEMRR